MKLLYLTQVDPSRPFNGSTRRIYDNLAHLAARHELHLVYVEVPPAGVGASVAPRLPPGLASARGVQHGGRGSRYFNPRLYAAASAAVRAHEIDAVIVEFGEAGVYGLLLRALHGVPFVYMSQNVEAPLHKERGLRSVGDVAFWPYLGLIERLCARHALMVTAVTPSDADAFRRLAPRTPVRRVPTGFDATVFKPEGARAASPETVVFVGSLEYAPNREAVEFLAAEVIPKVRAARPDTVFEIVGACPPGFERIAPDAVFTGYVEDLAQRLKRARLVVVPVRTGGGMRMKTVEALACGKLVIAADKGADGIDTGAVSRLRLVPRPEMAQAVLHELDSGRADDDVDFDFLCRTYSTEAILAAFERALEDGLLRWRRRRGRGRSVPAVSLSGGVELSASKVE